MTDEAVMMTANPVSTAIRCLVCNRSASEAQSSSMPRRVRCHCCMVYRSLAEPVVVRDEDWDAPDYTNVARPEACCGDRPRHAYRRLVGPMSARVAGRRWLDIGYDTGPLLSHAAAAGFETVGVDLSLAAVAGARGQGAICGRFPDNVPEEGHNVVSISYGVVVRARPRGHAGHEGRHHV